MKKIIQVAGKKDTTIDLKRLREYTSHGIEDTEERPIIWLILSGIFPNMPTHWQKPYQETIKTYETLKETFGFIGYENIPFNIDLPEIVKTLSPSDKKILQDIHVDIIRTSHQIDFFKDSDNSVPLNSHPLAPFHMHIARLERILFFFAKMNTAHGYMQGFNEFASVIFFVMSSNLPFFQNNYDHVEAFSYCFFQTLFGSTGLDELFNTRDNSATIMERLNRYSIVLKNHFPQISDTLQERSIEPMLYCLHWITLLFSQNYFIPDTIIIWDGLMAHFDHFLDYVNYVAVAQVSFLSHYFSNASVPKIIMTLQEKTTPNVINLMKRTNNLWNQDFPQV